ncbi:MAG: ice-binding family protein [Adhaeribacter sp.]
MRKLILLATFFFLVSFSGQAQVKPGLGAAAAFTVLAGTEVQNAGDTKIEGNVGVSPGTILVGLAPESVNGSQEAGTPAAAAAMADLHTAYSQAASQPATFNLSGQNLGGKTLLPGVYKFDGSADLSGLLTLDNGGNPDAVFIFQIGGDLTLAANAEVKLQDNARPRIHNIFWQVAGKVSMGGASTFRGTLLASQDIVVASNSAVRGRLLSRQGAVNLTNTNITVPTDLSVSQTKSEGIREPSVYSIGQSVTFTVTARNEGPVNAKGVRVTYELHSGFTFVSASTPAGTTFDPAFNRWTIADFPTGTSQTMQIVATVNGSKTEYLINNVTIAQDQFDEIQANNTSAANICVAPAPPGEITGPASVCINQEFDFSVTPIPGAASYSWSKPDGWEIISGLNTAAIRVRILPGAVAGQVGVTVGNTCAVSDPSQKNVLVSSGPAPTPGPIQTGPSGANPCVSEEFATYSIEPVATATAYNWTVPTGWTIAEGQGTTAIKVKIGTGSGQVTVSTLNGCLPPNPARVLAVSASVNPPAKPDAIVGEGAPCIGKEATYTVAGGSGATAYVWTLPDESWSIVSGQNTNSIVVVVGSTPGNITVKGTNGCGVTEELPLTVAPITNTPPDAITGPLSPCLKSSGNTYSVPARPGTSYFWSVTSGLTINGGQNTSSIQVSVGDNVLAGTISVIALNNCGPSAETKLTLSPAKAPEMPQPITATTPQPCVGQTELVFSIPPVAGATEYIWTLPDASWSFVGPATGTSITVTAGSTAGLVKVQAKNVCDLSPVRTLAVNPSVAVPAGTLQMTGKNNVCVSGTGAKPQESYQVNALPEATAYAWQVPEGWRILSGQGTTQIQVEVGTTPGPVQVAAVNNCGKGVEASLDVVISTTPSPAPGPIISSTAIPCVQQDNITYSVPAVKGAFSYKWDITGDWKITAGNGTTAITVIAGTVPATISVKAVNDCGESGSSTLEVSPSTQAPAVPLAITGKSAVCGGQKELSYSVAAVAQASTYQWQVPDGWQILTGQGSATITVEAGMAGGNIRVSAGNNCGSSQAQVLAVQVSTAPPAAAGPISGPGNICAARPGLSFSIAEVSGATSYIWTVPQGWTIESGQGSTTLVVSSGTLPGKITVKPESGCGEGLASELAVSPTNGLPAMPGVILGAAANICADETNLSYAIAPIAGVSTYNWTVPEGWTITGGQGSPAITVTAGKGGGEISVTAFNNCGASPARSLAVSPSLIPAAPLAITGQPIPCAGSTGNTYAVPAVPGATEYQWTVPAGWTITAGQGSPQITVAAGTTAGNIGVQAGNSCGQSPAALLPVTPSSTVPAIPGTIQGSNSVCGSSLDLTYTYSVAAETNASNYIWSVPNGWQITSGQGTLQITVKASTSPGTISVMAENGCGLSMVSILAVSVTGQAPPKPGIVSGSKTVCAGQQNLTYTVGSVSGAASYTWAVPADWTILSGQGTTTLQVQAGNTAGEVSVTATNGCGNSQASALAVALNSLPPQPLAIAGEPHQCAGNTGSVYRVEPVAGALSYTWSVPADWTITAGQGTPLITITAGKASGQVSVTANSDCGSSQAQLLTVTSSTTPSPAPGKISPAYGGLICSQQDGLAYSVEPVATATSYVWSVPEGWTITGGQGSTSITVKAGSGTGLISVKALNGCGESEASSLTVVPTQTASVDIGALSGEALVCAGRSGLVYAVAPVAGATAYQWLLPPGWTITAGEGTHQITVTAGRQGGKLSVTAANSCTNSLPASLDLQVQAQAVAPVEIQDISSPCGGLSYTLQPVGEAQQYTWTLPPGWTITAGQGTATIRVTAPEGSGKGLLTVVADNGNCSSAAITLEADPARAQAETVIANVFSPNGDGVNDTWEILNIQNYPDNDLVIINRWGNEVYRRKGYRNQWDGGQLSAGTYFYVLKMKVCDGSYKTYKGYVMIMR